MISIIHSGIQPIVKIITERFDNIQGDELNNYIIKRDNKNKPGEPLASLQRDIKVKKTNKKIQSS